MVYKCLTVCHKQNNPQKIVYEQVLLYALTLVNMVLLFLGEEVVRQSTTDVMADPLLSHSDSGLNPHDYAPKSASRPVEDVENNHVSFPFFPSVLSPAFSLFSI